MHRIPELTLSALGLLALVCTSPALAGDLSAPAPAAPAPAPTSGAFQLNLLYTGELWDNLAGGLRRGAMYMNNVDARLDVDVGKVFGIPGGTFVFEGFYENKQSVGNYLVGAVDQQSPIDTAANLPMVRLYQAYYDQALGSTDIRFGIYDLETEFATTKAMSLFLDKNLTWNTAFDQSGTMSANGQIGPGNYPYTPLALRVRQALGNDLSVSVAIADGAADNPDDPRKNDVIFTSNYGALLLGELDYTPQKTTKLMAGAWYLTSKLPVYSATPGLTTYGDAGAYVGGQMRLYAPSARRGLDAFLTAGIGSPNVSNTSASINGGLTYTGLLDARPTDKFGVSFHLDYASANWKAAQVAMGNSVRSYEAGFEGTYRARINEFLTVQPDIQYIVNTGYSATLKNDLIVGVHFEIGHVFEW